METTIFLAICLIIIIGILGRKSKIGSELTSALRHLTGFPIFRNKKEKNPEDEIENDNDRNFDNSIK
jgi:hypothetical protein